MPCPGRWEHTVSGFGAGHRWEHTGGRTLVGLGLEYRWASLLADLPESGQVSQAMYLQPVPRALYVDLSSKSSSGHRCFLCRWSS